MVFYNKIVSSLLHEPSYHIMSFPKFLLADNTDFPEAIFVVHTEFPRFIINVENDQIEWLEDFDPEDVKELETETENLIAQAFDFYDREIDRYEEWLRNYLHMTKSFLFS